MASDSRAAILGRIQQALKIPSPEPHWVHEPVGTGPVFFLPEPSEQAYRERFRNEFVAIQGEWLEADSHASGRQTLADWLAKEQITSILAVSNPLLRDLLEGAAGVEWIDGSSTSRAGWEKVQIGITPCESLVIESGTVVVSAGIAGRAPSVLPPIHLVIATADQLVPDIETAIARLRARSGGDLPSSFSLISGPSRTADIEKILVLGAHGPRRLALLLLPSAS